MKNVKHFFFFTITITTLFFGCLAHAAGKANILQAHTPKQKQTLMNNKQLKGMAGDSYCGYGTHIAVINHSDYLVYVRVPQSDDPYDFPVYPEDQDDNVDYIDSDDYYPGLHIIVLASDDYTVLFNGYVPNCQNLYIDNPYYATENLKASKKPAVPTQLKFYVSK